MNVLRVLRLLCVFACLASAVFAGPAPEQHLLYVASPGIRNYVEYGGVGILVFDIDNGYKFVRRIPTWTVPPGKTPENVKGIAASAATGRVYVTSLTRMIAIDAVTGARYGIRPMTAVAIAWRSRPWVRCSTFLNSKAAPGISLTQKAEKYSAHSKPGRARITLSFPPTDHACI
jgi:hypothetical protein